MGNPKDPIAGVENIVPSSEYRQPKIHHVTNSSPILDVKSITLALKCPSCKEPFNVRANLTAVTETTATAEMRFNAAGANFPVHENRKLKFDNKTRNKGQLKVVAAAACRNYTPPKSAGKRRHAYDLILKVRENVDTHMTLTLILRMIPLVQRNPRSHLVAKLIFLDQLCELSPYLPRSLLESHVPYAILRSVYSQYYLNSSTPLALLSSSP
ncbi:unnamed protein product [Fraxinus pennsylvanica]|uniref:Uncharacterized protein n=1 Tax=Fraxinus pennsylvanica TaxID=56036 RepID=A0AAD1ZUA3_9LAMI|nr:unnamed protein product [Fraxinus pennsylvanica]